MKANFVVIEQSFDKQGRIDFSQCLKVCETYDEAVGLAYNTIDERANDRGEADKLTLHLPISLEADTGVVINYDFGDGFHYCILVYDNRQQFKESEGEA